MRSQLQQSAVFYWDVSPLDTPQVSSENSQGTAACTHDQVQSTTAWNPSCSPSPTQCPELYLRAKAWEDQYHCCWEKVHVWASDVAVCCPQSSKALKPQWCRIPSPGAGWLSPSRLQLLVGTIFSDSMCSPTLHTAQSWVLYWAKGTISERNLTLFFLPTPFLSSFHQLPPNQHADKTLITVITGRQCSAVIKSKGYDLD